MLGRLGMAFLALLVAYAALRFAAPNSGFTWLAAIAFYVTGMLFALQLARRNARRLTWRLRNRLIVAYLFIAFVPIALIAILAALAGWELVGGTAVYLVSSELERRTNAMDGVAHLLAETPIEKRANTIHDVIPYLEHLFPRVMLAVRDEKMYRYPADSEAPSAPVGWKDASGLVMKDGQLHSWAHVTREGTEVTLLAPITSDLLADLSPGIGQVSLISFNSPGRESAAKSPPSEPRRRRAARLPEPANRFDLAVDGGTPAAFAYWDAPETKQDKCLLIVRTRPSVVFGKVFGQVDLRQGLFALFVFVVALLLLVWVVSLIMGISLTRTITGAIHNLYEGTEHIKGGDFSHRIAVQGHDQLAELALSFNGMTENLERLFVVEKEQERLQSEIAIAREVQSQLFPRGALAMKTIEMTGVCHPARMVSGDYYDFIRLQNSNLALAIGDVAGKGISAALLMASIQSIMRTQLTAGIPMHAAATQGGNGRAREMLSVAELVSQLNQQVCANTAPEKFATFYFGLYDDESRVLTYTNAGHLPPILMRDGQAERLEVTGTVVGAFPFARYEEKTVQLRAGDLLVAFTDGIVEPENAYGEPFGEDKLVDLLVRYEQQEPAEIMTRIMETVEQWTGSSELYDDMTLLIARGV